MSDTKVVFCCKRDIKSAMRSGMIGTLQKFGYTEANRDHIVACVHQSFALLQQNPIQPLNATTDDILLTIYGGLLIVFQHSNSRGVSIDVDEMNDALGEFEEMRVQTAEQAFSRRRENGEHDSDEQEQEAAQQTITNHPAFSGHGGHIPGYWTWGKCFHS